MQPKFKALVAMADNRVIGFQGKIPWHLPDDLKWFKKMTLGKMIVLGRKTFDSVGFLPGRKTLILSRFHKAVPGGLIINRLEDIDHAEEVFICGGAEVYKLALPLVSDLYVTHVRGNFEGDAFFPIFEDQFRATEIITENEKFWVAYYRRI